MIYTFDRGHSDHFPFFSTYGLVSVGHGEKVMSEQTITCEGCSSKWITIGVSNQIVARLVECPLCAEKEEV